MNPSSLRPQPPSRSASRWLFALLALLSPLLSHAAHLEFVTEVNGTISDVTAQRILYSATEGGVLRLKVIGRTTGTIRTIPDIPEESPFNEQLTSRGAIFGTTADDGSFLYEWTGTTPLGRGGTPRGLHVSPVSKQYAVWPIWTVGPFGQGRYVNFRDVIAFTSTLVGNSYLTGEPDVSDAGEIAFTQGPAPTNVFRYRDGQTTQLTNATTYSHFDPLTDGINVVYRKQISSTNSEIVMYNDSVGEVVLRSSSAEFLTPRVDYLPNGGWIAFTRVDIVQGTAVRQVWLRSPQGGIFPASTYGTDSYINSVGNGQVMYVNGGYLYLGRPGMAPVLISPFADGTQSVWLQGSWHVYFGGALYRVVI
jgi:hypothetical protein